MSEGAADRLAREFRPRIGSEKSAKQVAPPEKRLSSPGGPPPDIYRGRRATFTQALKPHLLKHSNLIYPGTQAAFTQEKSPHSSGTGVTAGSGVGVAGASVGAAGLHLVHVCLDT